MTEAVNPSSAIYRTLGNDKTRYMSTEMYKEKLLGGSDYRVYIEFPSSVTGFKEGFLFTGPDNGITVKVINNNTLRFTVDTSDLNTNDEQFAKFAIDSMRVIVEKVSDSSVKYYTDIKVDSQISQQVKILQ